MGKYRLRKDVKPPKKVTDYYKPMDNVWPPGWDPVTAYPPRTPKEAWKRHNQLQAQNQRLYEQGQRNYEQNLRDAEAYQRQREHFHREAAYAASQGRTLRRPYLPPLPAQIPTRGPRPQPLIFAPKFKQVRSPRMSVNPATRRIQNLRTAQKRLNQNKQAQQRHQNFQNKLISQRIRSNRNRAIARRRLRRGTTGTVTTIARGVSKPTRFKPKSVAFYKNK